MGEIAEKVRAAKLKISTAESDKREGEQELAKLQQGCPHAEWKFVKQYNANHERLWHVVEGCTECGKERSAEKEPVCMACGTTLVRADDDPEARAAMPANKYSEGALFEAVPYRCPGAECRKIHILHISGD